MELIHKCVLRCWLCEDFSRSSSLHRIWLSIFFERASTTACSGSSTALLSTVSDFVCFFLWLQYSPVTGETLLDKAVELQYCGSIISAASKPAPFVCLLLKLLQIQPDKDIVVAYIQQSEFKYVRLLGAMYMRLAGLPTDVYTYLESLLADWRKVRTRSTTGWAVTTVDQLIDGLLVDDSFFGIALPYLPRRAALEKASKLSPRESLLDSPASAAPVQQAGYARAVSGSELNLSVEASNELRAKLGLPPLR